MTALRGKTIIATSNVKKAEKLGNLLKNHGARMVKFPLIKISAANNPSLEKATQLNDIQWVVFSSSNSVTYFFEWLRAIQQTSHETTFKYAVIGKATAETLAQYGKKADFISSCKNAESFARELINVLGATPQQILISAGNLSSDNLLHILESKHFCRKVITYKTQKIKYAETAIQNLIQNQDNDIVLFMSPSAVEAFYTHHSADLNQTHLKVAVIGSTTQKALQAQGVTPDFMPSLPNLEVLVNEMAQYFEHNQPKV